MRKAKSVCQTAKEAALGVTVMLLGSLLLPNRCSGSEM